MDKFVIAQIIGAICLVLIFLNIQQKSKSKVLTFQIVINLLYTVQFFLLDAKTGAVISIINAIRCIVFYIFKKKNIKPSFIVLSLFMSVAVISGIVTWQNIYSSIVIISTLIYTYGLWQDNIKVIRICAAVMAIGWVVYSLLVGAYSGAITETVEFISAIIAIYRYDVKKGIRK